MSLNPKKMIENAMGANTKKLAEVLESIHGRLELMNEQLGNILSIMEKKYGIKGDYKEDIEATASLTERID